MAQQIRKEPKIKWRQEFVRRVMAKSADLAPFPDNQVLNKLYCLIEADNYTQILFDFGKNYVEICLAYFQKVEDYERCALIVRQVDNFNLNQGTRIVLKVY